MTPQQTWETTLTQLQLQMTDATFDSWLKDTTLLDASNGTWFVGVKNNMAKEWLESRLHDTITRTISGIAGHNVALDFVVQPTTEAPAPATSDGSTARADLVRSINRDEILRFDVYDAGYNNHAHYIQQFWGAYLGADAMQVWNYIRSFYTTPRYIYDRQERVYVLNPDWEDWTPSRQFRPSDLARSLKSKNQKHPNRHQVTGCWRYCQNFKNAHDAGETWNKCHHCTDRSGKIRMGDIVEAKPSAAYPEGRPTCRYWKQGILEQLNAERICKYHQTGDPGKARTVFYQISVYQTLPLLTAHQVDTLNAETRREHETWLKRHGISVSAWKQQTDNTFAPHSEEE